MVGILVIVGTFTSLLEGIFIKVYNSKNNQGGFLFTAFISLFAMLYFLMTDKGGFNCSTELMLYAITGCIMYCGASYLTYVALREGSFAITMLIISYSLVFSIGYGIFFLKESLSIYMKIGLILILVSLFLVRNANEEKGTVKFSLKWIVCTILSVVGAGLYGVIQRMQQIHFDGKYDNEFMVIAIGLSALILFVIGFIKDGKYIKNVMKKGVLLSASAGIANGITNMISLVLNSMVAISVITPIRSGAKTIISFLVSIFIFKEKFTISQIVGVAMSGVALILLNM